MDELPPECEMFGLLDILSGQWTLHILCLLSVNGPMRFGMLRRRIEGISARLLTLRLRALEERGFVIRDVTPSKAPEVTYSPAPRLEEMSSVVKQLHHLALKWNAEDI